MEHDEVRLALAGLGVVAGDVRRIDGGWANWTFLVDRTLIARFPRTREVAESTRKELRLLPGLATHLSYPVPAPTMVGEWNGWPFFGYPLITGHPLDASRVTTSALEFVGRAIGEIHAFPLHDAAEMLGTPAATAWRTRYEDLWISVEEIALPELDPSVRSSVTRQYAAMLDNTPMFPTCLVHNDLGPEHVLLDRDGRVAGIIDFEDAAIGDPAVDLTPMVALAGIENLATLSAGRDLGEHLAHRIAFYRWMGSVHAIIYGVTQGDPGERDAGIAGLRLRLP